MSTGEVLLTIREAQLHEVIDDKEQLKEWGELQLITHSSETGSGLWIKIGKSEWAVDTAMPTLEAAPNTYMFALEKGRFYSVLLSAGTPEEEVWIFREILHECTAFEVAGASKLSAKDQEEILSQVAQEVADDEELATIQPDVPPGASPTASQRILQGAAAVQEKLLASANWASRKIIEQSEAYQAKYEATQDPVKVSPHVMRTVKLARKAAETGSNVANRIASGVADISIKIAETVIRHLGPSKTGEELHDPNKRPHAAKEVAAAALLATTGIFDSMEQASKLVLNAGGKAGGDFIGHKYGQEAGQVTKDAASASVTGGMAVMTMQKMGLKRIARRIAKRTAHGLVKAYVIPSSQTGATGASSGSQEPKLSPAQKLQQAASQGQGQGNANFGQYGPPAGQVPAQTVQTPSTGGVQGQNLGSHAPGQYGAAPQQFQNPLAGSSSGLAYQK